MLQLYRDVRSCWLLHALILLFFGAQNCLAQNATVTTPNVKAELLAYAPHGLTTGKQMWVGLMLTHQPGWHTYWQNPGDSGLPTTLAWQLPQGVRAGAIDWPAPSRLPLGPLVNYGYHDTVLLPVPLEIDPAFEAPQLVLRLRADWLVCKEICIPESGEFSLTLPMQQVLNQHAALFQRALASRPQAMPTVQAIARVEGGKLAVSMDGLPDAAQGQSWSFFLAQEGVIDHGAQIESGWRGAQLWARLPLSAQRSESPANIDIVLTRNNAKALQIRASVVGGWPGPAGAPASAAVTNAAGASAALGNAADSIPLLWALVLAFLGGALLNLMPCVFPVLSLKIISFTAHAENRTARIAGGVAYTVGVVITFTLLAGLLLGLRAAGAGLGWGFQLQAPLFVGLMMILFVVIGLNLLGVFEIANILPSSVASLRARQPLLDDLLTGVLAVLVASPCTAPFMGAALGAALTLPAPAALAVFELLALGMAAPYLLACLWPGLARWLPRPGQWMVRFKLAMSVPMFATALWLGWVLLQQVTSTSLPTSARWQPWSAAAVAQAQAGGRPVFIDFTAAWCVTCQYNKRTTLSDPVLLAELDAKGVVFLQADWTRRDADITRELARLGRAGVPVYVVYAPGSNQATVLPELLTLADIRQAASTWPRQAAK
jgi:DsbC/DsbD-like thiol-disulfide interchange protein/cytochrome c biogenesis protein CcdA